MSPADAPIVTAMSGFPRVSGDEPDAVFLRAQEGKFSPRERG